MGADWGALRCVLLDPCEVRSVPLVQSTELIRVMCSIIPAAVSRNSRGWGRWPEWYGESGPALSNLPMDSTAHVMEGTSSSKTKAASPGCYTELKTNYKHHDCHCKDAIHLMCYAWKILATRNTVLLTPNKAEGKIYPKSADVITFYLCKLLFAHY